MSTETGSRANGTDQVGKVFIVRRHGLRECLVCGELFIRSTAPEHAEVDCYPFLELSLAELSEGGEDVI